MDEIPSIRGQLIIRSIIEEYKHLLEVLGDERMLKKGNRPGAGLGPGRPTDDQFDGARVTQEILQKLTRLFQQLRISYNQCVDELERSGEIKVELPLKKSDSSNHEYEEKDFDRRDIISPEKQALIRDVQDKNSQLKLLIDQMRQLVWDIDKMKSS